MGSAQGGTDADQWGAGTAGKSASAREDVCVVILLKLSGQQFHRTDVSGLLMPLIFIDFLHI